MTFGVALEVLRREYNCRTMTGDDYCKGGHNCDPSICKNYADDEDVTEAIKTVLDAFDNCSEFPNSLRDLIDRAEAQTELQFAARRYTVAHEAHGEGQVVWSENLISVTDAMNALRKVAPVQAEQKWIPCSERLPKYWKRVLVCFKAGRKCPHDQIQVGCFGTHEVEDEWFEKIGNVTVLHTDKYYYPLDNVTAWMPLPEPYGGDTE